MLQNKEKAKLEREAMKEDDERKANVGDAAPSYDSSVSSNTSGCQFV